MRNVYLSFLFSQALYFHIVRWVLCLATNFQIQFTAFQNNRHMHVLPVMRPKNTNRLCILFTLFQRLGTLSTCMICPLSLPNTYIRTSYHTRAHTHTHSFMRSAHEHKHTHIRHPLASRSICLFVCLYIVRRLRGFITVFHTKMPSSQKYHIFNKWTLQFVHKHNDMWAA